jgi:RNA polymerase sigma factor (sigma-70 family)
LKKQISNEEFNIAYRNQDNINIIRKVSGRYIKLLDQDTIKSCGLTALWRALSSYDPSYKQKFTSSLWRFTDWECKRALKEFSAKKNRQHLSLDDNIEIIDTNAACDVEYIREGISLLAAPERELINEYYIERRSMEEIGQRQGYSKEAIRQRLKKALHTLKGVMENDSIQQKHMSSNKTT